MSYLDPQFARRSAALLACAGLAAPAAGRGDDPPVGTVRILPVVSVSLAVGSTDKEAKRVVYSPPPGWYIRSHRVECQRTGLASYTVSTVPAGWAWSSAEKTAEAAKTAAAATVSGYEVKFGGSASVDTDASGSARQKTTASHHALVVDVAARGKGLWQGGGGIELKVIAEIVFVGPAGPPER